MMHNFKAVVFDMDGLMFNTEDLYDEVLDEVLKRRGKEFSVELKLKMMGLPGKKAFQVMKDECQLNESIEQLKKETYEVFDPMIPDRIECMPGVKELFAIVENLALPKAVATSSNRDFATKALGSFGFIERLEFVLTGEDVANGKPNPDIYLLAAKRLGVTAKDLLVFEDSLRGTQAAVAAGAFTVAVPTSHSQSQNFSHANLIAKSLVDPCIIDLFA